jgi:hypothetical protein
LWCDRLLLGFAVGCFPLATVAKTLFNVKLVRHGLHFAGWDLLVFGSFPECECHSRIVHLSHQGVTLVVAPSL